MERKAIALQDLSSELSQVKIELDHIQTQVETLLERQQILTEKRKDIEKEIEKYNARDSPTEEGIDWSSRSFSWTDSIEQCLKQTFKLRDFRNLQRAAINATMSGIDCIILMPTGAGKSLCFQLPAVVSNGITLVVSPLISLIEDQLISLSELSIEATLLNATSSKEHVHLVQSQMIGKSPTKLKLLYVTPEKISKSKRFMAKLEKCYQAGNLARIVIDEVHCTSQWGHDFRPDYKILGILKRQFPKVPILGLTATATSKVVEDVKTMLGLNEGCLVLRSSFNRPNLFYEVNISPSSEKEHFNNIASIVKHDFKNQAGIVYCYSRKEAEQVTSELIKQGIKAACYHSDIEYQIKSQNHKNWFSQKIQVIVATIAFGMGIDKPDVRFIIHNSISKSIQNYYQESGRAGRDSQPARCILFYKFSDVFRQIASVFMEHTGTDNLHAMLRYCLDLKVCRRTSLGKYFGEIWDQNICKEMCDSCVTSANGFITKDITKYVIELTAILNQAASRKERLTPMKLLDAWMHKGAVALRLPSSKPPKMSKEDCERVIVKFVLEGVLKEQIHFTPYNNICYLVEGPRNKLAIDGRIAVNLDFRRSVSVNRKEDLIEKVKTNTGLMNSFSTNEDLEGEVDLDFEEEFNQNKTGKKRKFTGPMQEEAKKKQRERTETVIEID